MDVRETVVVVQTGGRELTRMWALRLACWAAGKAEQGDITTSDVAAEGWSVSEHEGEGVLYITCPSPTAAYTLEDTLNTFGPQVVPDWRGATLAYRVYIMVAVPFAGHNDISVYIGPFAHAAEAREYTRGWRFASTGRYAFVPALAEHWHAVGIVSEAEMRLDVATVPASEHDTVQELAQRVARVVWVEAE